MPHQYNYHFPPYNWCAADLHPSPTRIVANVRFFLKQVRPRNVRDIGIQLADIVGLLDAVDDAQGLPRVVALIFEKATDHRPRAEMYAQLCAEIVAALARAFPHTAPTAGAATLSSRFVVQLLRLCRAQFARSYGEVRPAWLDAPPRISGAALSDAELDRTLRVLADRRRALGTLRFMGGLFTRQLLPAQILAGHVEVLLSGIADSGSEHKIEALSVLLGAVAPHGAANLKVEVPGIDRAFSMVEDLRGHGCPDRSAQRAFSDHPLGKILRMPTFDSNESASHAITPGPLATAHFIPDINSIQYPNGVVGPLPELNRNAAQGNFKHAIRGVSSSTRPHSIAYRYDREFLLQFMSVCALKPAQLLYLDNIGLARRGRGTLDNLGHENTDYEAVSHLDQRPFAQRLLLEHKSLSSLDLDEESDDSDAYAGPWEMAYSRVKRLLDDLPMDAAAGHMDALVDEPGVEPDRDALAQVATHVVEKAANSAACAALSVRLCADIQWLMGLSQIGGINNTIGLPATRSELFFKYLFDCFCSQFRRNWVGTQQQAVAPAAAMCPNSTAENAASDNTKETEPEDEDLDAFCWDQYCAKQKAKDRSFALLKFIAELFKRKLLPERNIPLIFETILENVDKPPEQKLEALCMLLRAVGRILDKPGAHSQLDTYLARVKELVNCPDFSMRMVCVYTDLINLRERGW
ncbi:hypothetical protein HYPSUDRAFT_62837 [Hypholoma sublateritium FD-334 SS-4]|uniref:MIF4G domain-containing protein n=1 Tax=Hypholoma sublateritium (strain FD-334 SS-4) TaxID=945553 RepID=A0A0D2MUY3_HYPSF|nr:hypothetical protein HYPSUDRAFT_62837 [Hypholoma sublateritium FD-334 SS-4]